MKKKRILQQQKLIILVRVAPTKKQARRIMKVHLREMSRIQSLRSPKLFSKMASMSTRGS